MLLTFWYLRFFYFRRGKARCHKISAERIARLNSLAFVWSPSDAKWMEKYAHLRDYFMATGHSSIPFQGECELERLGWWANTQRQAYRKGRLSNDRVRMLEKLHFVWRPSRFRKRGMVREELPTWEKRARGEDNSLSSSFYDESMQDEQDNSAISSASTRVYTYRVQDSIRKEAPVPQSALAAPLSSPQLRVFPVQKQSAAVIAPERSSKDQMPRSPATWHTSSESSVHRFKTQGGLSQHDEECRVYGFPRIPHIATLFATAEARFVSHNRPWEWKFFCDWLMVTTWSSTVEAPGNLS